MEMSFIAKGMEMDSLVKRKRLNSFMTQSNPYACGTD